MTVLDDGHDRAALGELVRHPSPEMSLEWREFVDEHDALRLRKQVGEGERRTGIRATSEEREVPLLVNWRTTDILDRRLLPCKRVKLACHAVGYGSMYGPGATRWSTDE